MTVFDSVAADYDAFRPEYPDELYATVEAYAGPLAGRPVLDLAAGTGIATRRLVTLGARVVAVDLGADMLRVLHARSPSVPAFVARGEALPLRDGSVDVITCATAWHWIDGERGPAEALRVLRPGGVLAVWWGFGAGNPQGKDEASRRERAVCSRWEVWQRPTTQHSFAHVEDEFAHLPSHGFIDPVVRDMTTERVLSPADHVRHLQTHSAVIGLGEEDRAAVLKELGDALGDLDAIVEQVACHLVMVRRP